MPRVMPVQPKWLRAGLPVARPAGVDRTARTLRGYVVAQAGPFKDRRGEFNEAGLQMIVEQINAAPKGLKSRFTHPGLSDDGLGKFLGRATNARLGEAVTPDGVTVKAVRADLRFDSTAFKTPSGDLASYVMDLAESDPAALSSSLVIEPREEQRLNPDGTALRGDDGEPLPPLWFPTKLHASDLVDTGDAVDGLLSAGLDPDALPDAVVRRAEELLDTVFRGQPRDVVEARCAAWLGRYLGRRDGIPSPTATTGTALEKMRAQARDNALALERLRR